MCYVLLKHTIRKQNHPDFYAFIYLIRTCSVSYKDDGVFSRHDISWREKTQYVLRSKYQPRIRGNDFINI